MSLEKQPKNSTENASLPQSISRTRLVSYAWIYPPEGANVEEIYAPKDAEEESLLNEGIHTVYRHLLRKNSARSDQTRPRFQLRNLAPAKRII